MKNQQLFKKTILGSVISSLFLSHASFAAPINLVQYPAGTSRKQPAPNVIISVDNSGSMGNSGILALQNALRDTFAPSNLPDGTLRLAYQSLHDCNSIPGTSGSCVKNGTAWNTMRELAGSTSTSEDSHRGQFFRWINTLNDGGNTPTHNMTWRAGEYMKTTGVNNPWNEEPGTADPNPVTCRRAYHILMTDGGWNGYPYNNNYIMNMGLQNEDGKAQTFPDGVAYSPTSNQTRIYADAWGNDTATRRISGTNYTLNKPTVSDLAFHYWATDLQPGIANEVAPLIKKAGSETFSDGAATTTLTEYWNPKNDPASWQHLNTFTIGFNNAATWPNIGSNPIFNNAGGMYGGDFGRAVVGTRAWREPFSTDESGRQEELWHIAFNSRGKFYPAQTSQDLKNAFKEIVDGIVADNTIQITAAASTSASSSRSDIGIFKGGYDASKAWSGYVRSNIVPKGSNTEVPNPAWDGGNSPANVVTTADKLDALTAADITNRFILTTNDLLNTGVVFNWETGVSKLSANQKLYFGADALAADRVAFIRGDRTKEGNTISEPFRIRQSRQGDIVNSGIWVVSNPISNFSYEGYQNFASTNKNRVPMVYVGGNDGMLHGFSGLDGAEKIAFVPKGVVKNLVELTQPGYTHRYFVDGSPFAGDVNTGAAGSPDWRTMLVGTLGAGGKGYFVLDVTNPGKTSPATASNFTPANAANLVVKDNTFHESDNMVATDPEADIGHIFSRPSTVDSNPLQSTQIVKMNNGRWAAVMGNGYNSLNERPVLLIQYLDGNKALKRIVAASSGANATGNGLSAPALVDINSDGSPDVIYAGDLKGNMWKFDVTSASEASWNVGFSGNPLFSAKYSTGGPSASSSDQPITAAPIAKANDRGVGGLMVAFGTGQNITEADRTDASVQTFYSVLDNTQYKLVAGKLTIDTSNVTPSPITSNNQLVQQSLVSTTPAVSGASGDFWQITQNNVTYTGAGAKRGWYFNLPASGERLLKTPTFYDGSNLLDVFSEVPASGGSFTQATCTVSPQAAKQYRTLLNIMDGKKPSIQLFDSNGDGYFNAGDAGVSRMNMAHGDVVITRRNSNSGNGLIRARIDNGSSSGAGSPPNDVETRAMPVNELRPSWRQVQ